MLFHMANLWSLWQKPDLSALPKHHLIQRPLSRSNMSCRNKWVDSKAARCLDFFLPMLCVYIESDIPASSGDAQPHFWISHRCYVAPAACIVTKTKKTTTLVAVRRQVVLKWLKKRDITKDAIFFIFDWYRIIDTKNVENIGWKDAGVLFPHCRKAPPHLSTPPRLGRYLGR